MGRTGFTVIGGRLVSGQRLLVYGSALRLRVSVPDVCFNLKGTGRLTAAAAAAAAVSLNAGGAETVLTCSLPRKSVRPHRSEPTCSPPAVITPLLLLLLRTATDGLRKERKGRKGRKEGRKGLGCRWFHLERKVPLRLFGFL